MGNPWTPGPYYIAVTGDGTSDFNCDILAPDGDCDPWHIAQTYFFPEPGIEQANARLIAASPTMAEYIQKKAVDGCPEAAAIWETINAAR